MCDRCAIIAVLKLLYINSFSQRSFSWFYLLSKNSGSAAYHEKSPMKKVQGWLAASHRPADRCLPGEAAPATEFIAGGCADPSEGWSPWSKSAQHGGAVVGSTWGGCSYGPYGWKIILQWIDDVDDVPMIIYVYFLNVSLNAIICNGP